MQSLPLDDRESVWSSQGADSMRNLFVSADPYLWQGPYGQLPGTVLVRPSNTCFARLECRRLPFLGVSIPSGLPGICDASFKPKAPGGSDLGLIPIGNA